MPRSTCLPRPVSFVLPAVMAGVAGIGLCAALPVGAQTLPANAVAAVPSAVAASATRPPQRVAAPPPVNAGTVVPPLKPAATPPKPAAVAVAPSPAASANAAGPRWVALDIGHVPGGGSRSASGVAEHNFNLRFGAALETRLQQQGLQVRRLPTGLSLADRARRAQGAALVVSVHHDAASPPPPLHAASAVAAGPAGRKAQPASTGSGFQLRVGQAEPLACARAVATQLQTAGRHFSTSGTGAWADKALGVRAGGEGALLQQAEVPVLQVSLANIGNPAEERLAGDATWLSRQAGAVAKGLALCLQRPAGKPVPAHVPAAVAPAAASAPRRA